MQKQELLVALAVALALMVFMVTAENFNCDHMTCSKCIGTPSCVWCSDQKITLVEFEKGVNLTHCISTTSLKFEKFIEACKDDIINPATVTKILEDEKLSTVELSPQRVSLEMRAGESAKISVKYEHLANYPLDVYCLMDGSKSMNSQKKLLSEVSEDLVKGLKKLSNNVQLGFGIFVDKPVLPYTDESGWKGNTCDCVETFGFKNILPLTSEGEIFKQKVNVTKGSTNVDLPEGTLDALMQVLSCPSKVGWRNTRMKIVVVFTDAGFHIAGDGRLAGIVKPNDKECHLDSEGEYTMTKWQDYPSISELRSVLTRSDVYTTFAVTATYFPLYKQLSYQLPRSGCSLLEENNIVSLITEFTKEAISTVNLKQPKNIMKELEVDVTSRCKDNAENATSICKNMDPGDEAEFFINIKVKSCPELEHYNTTLNFTLDSSSQSFLLDLKLLCQCECELDNTQEIPNAVECNNVGDLKCGVCSCHEGFIGDKCHCKEGDSSNQGIDENTCIDSNSKSKCNGQGKCVCGQCQCDNKGDPMQVISGKYCQCNDFNCRSPNGEICSGHGQCNCNECECNNGWTGTVCECQNSTTECKKSAEDEICSSHGKCTCNQCHCEEEYLGKYCEDCKDCEYKCDEHKFCAQCLVFDAGDECKAHCSSYNVTIVSDMTESYAELCSVTDDEGCRFLFQIKYNKDEILLWAEQYKECYTEVNLWIVMGGILGAVVLVGLLLLITWKIITNIKDKREYANFTSSRKMAVWSENVSPLYKPAVTTVQNPLFESTSTGQY